MSVGFEGRKSRCELQFWVLVVWPWQVIQSLCFNFFICRTVMTYTELKCGHKFKWDNIITMVVIIIYALYYIWHFLPSKEKLLCSILLSQPGSYHKNYFEECCLGVITISLIPLPFFEYSVKIKGLGSSHSIPSHQKKSGKIVIFIYISITFHFKNKSKKYQESAKKDINKVTLSL